MSRHAAEMKECTDKTILLSLLMGMRSRQAPPLLAILGGFIGLILSLMTYSDGETVDAEIAELNQTQASMSYLFSKQIHIVRAYTEEVRELSKNKERLTRNEGQVSQNSLRLENLFLSLPILHAFQFVPYLLFFSFP